MCFQMHEHNPMYSLYGALPVAYVPVLVTCGALMAHPYTYAPPRCRTSQYHMTFTPISESLRNDPADPVFDRVGLPGLMSITAMLFYWPKLFASLLSSTVLAFSFSFDILVLWAWGVLTDCV